MEKTRDKILKEVTKTIDELIELQENATNEMGKRDPSSRMWYVNSGEFSGLTSATLKCIDLKWKIESILNEEAIQNEVTRV